ncbi:MAG: hypothetical protein WKF84_15155 [Pyrinomonadaceae bacterium]
MALPLVSSAGASVPLASLLEKTSTVAEKMWMKNYLADVSKEVKYFYRSMAEEVPHTPASALLSDHRLQKSRYLFGRCNAPPE